MMKALDDLANEVRLSFHAFSEFARLAHGDLIDPPGRAILEFLVKSGPATVPDMARARGVTRQHVQTIVNGLEADDLVAASVNPAHKRSSLFVLTASGRELIEAVVTAEAALLEPLLATIEPARITEAADLLAEIRIHLSELEQMK